MAVQTPPSDDGWKTPLESISRKHLSNILNHVNFKGGYVVVNLKNLIDENRFSLRAKPEPCAGKTARLAWVETPPANIDSAPHQLVNYLIDNGARLVIVGGEATNINQIFITVLLPEHCYATSRRRTERFIPVPVRAMLSANDAEAMGFLSDFGGGFVRVTLAGKDAGFLSKGGGKQRLGVALANGKRIVYNGKGIIRRRTVNGEKVDLIVALTAPPEGESPAEQESVPAGDLVATCRHPLSERVIRLPLISVSYDSFVVSENPKRAMLFPALVIPEMSLHFGTNDSARCAAKVAGGSADAWRISILDMPISDQRRLFSFVEKERGMRSAVSTAVDPEDVVKFFFEAGFIYPEKYAGFAKSRRRLRKMLSRLYVDAPSICQHFVQDDRGVIEAHVSMVRFYERSWLIHHYASLAGKGAGSSVLARIFRYINSYSPFPSTRMEYLMSYYRSENRFPQRVFGGFASFLGAPGFCSVDAFAYHYHRFDRDKEKGGDPEWRLEPACRDDLLRLGNFYAGLSGGLMLKAFGLEAPGRGLPGEGDIDSEFRKAGLRRKKGLFSLKREGKLTAVVMALDSDAGLNMSNLMKCIHVFVIDPEGLPFHVLTGQLDGLSSLYEERRIPILLFPSSYANRHGVVAEKIYNLLVFHSSVGKQFAEFTERLTNRTMRRKYGVLTTDQKREAGEQR